MADKEWDLMRAKMKLASAERDLKAELKKPTSKQNKMLISSLRSQIPELKNKAKGN